MTGSAHAQGRQVNAGKGPTAWISFRAHVLRTWPLLLVLLTAAALRFWRLGQVPLIGDESYYWLWSEQLAPSYFDHPAGVALMVRLSTLLAGPSEAGIRWLNATLGFGAVLLTYLIGRRLFSRYAGIVAALLLALGAPYLISSRFVYTDALHLFLLLLNLWLLIPLVVERRAHYRSAQFWAVGLSMAALLNTKYSAYLYALAVVALLLWTRRDLIRDRRAWGAIALACCGLLPTLLWNATHQWASFRWQVQHFADGVMGRASFLGSLWHVVSYLTPPLVLFALLGAARIRQPGQRLLLLPAAVLILPVALSPANSPRNLTTGVALLLLLAADATGDWIQRGHRFSVNIIVGSIVVATGIWGLGTVLETLAPSPWPHNAVAEAIRKDSVGWRELARSDLPDTTIFALDYSIASQIWYYSGRPVYTSWGQYQLWGIPDFAEVTIVALDYLSEEVISSRLADAFQYHEGPQHLRYNERGVEKEVFLWQAEGLKLEKGAFLQMFDFLTLLRADQPGDAQP